MAWAVKAAVYHEPMRLVWSTRTNTVSYGVFNIVHNNFGEVPSGTTIENYILIETRQ